MDSVKDFQEKVARLSLGGTQPLKERNYEDQKDLNTDDQVLYNKLVTKAKQIASQGDVKRALELTKQACAIYSTEKLKKRIAKMEEYLHEYGNDEDEVASDEEGDMLHVGDGFYLYKDLFNKLYSHQKEGVLWMWGMYRKKKGGILGDDMGLGKTIQVIAFLSGMFDAEKLHAGLLIMPVSLIVNWEKEFEKWAPGIQVESYHGTKKERERALGKVQRRGGILLTSYGMVVTNKELLSQKNGREFVWDYIILDEGHKIKNPSMKTSKSIQALPARNRLILTGTPIQNNLKELWALFDWAHQGALLGTARTFAMEYDNPICKARQRDATMGEKRLGQEMSESLKRIISPYFMRRTKAEVNKKNKNIENSIKEEKSCNKTPSMPTLSRKNDLIAWTFLSETQQKIYRDFIETEAVKELLMTSKSPLTALTVLKKICDHPRLLSTLACAQLGLDGRELTEEEMESMESRDCAADKVHQIPDDILIAESGKLVFLVDLLDNLKSEGHRCLVFSQSRKVLDIIQKVLANRRHKVMRLDGTIRHLYEREQIIQKFQTDSSYSVFLLTTQVGGVGLTLTAADRVVIFDPSWNPATDAQAVDRAFRLGQTKNVVIYRLITCGTVEEKIYRRQIFKDSITRQTTGNNKNPYRYFTKQELHELFILDNPRFSATQEQLAEMHANQRHSDTSLDEHIAFLHTLDIFGLSDHDLMFSNEGNRDDEDEDDEDNQHQENNYIQSRVQKAQDLLSLESSQRTQLQDQISQYPRNFEYYADTSQPVSQIKTEKKQPTKVAEPIVIPNDSDDEEFVDADDRSGQRSPVNITGDEASFEQENHVTKLEDEQCLDAGKSPAVKQEYIDMTDEVTAHDNGEAMSVNGAKTSAYEEDLNQTLGELTLEDQAVQADLGSETEQSPVMKVKKGNRIESDSDEDCVVTEEKDSIQTEQSPVMKVKKGNRIESDSDEDCVVTEEKDSIQTGQSSVKNDKKRVKRIESDSEEEQAEADENDAVQNIQGSPNQGEDENFTSGNAMEECKPDVQLQENLCGEKISADEQELEMILPECENTDPAEDKENSFCVAVDSPLKTPNKKRGRRKSCAANMKVPSQELENPELIYKEELMFSPNVSRPVLSTKPTAVVSGEFHQSKSPASGARTTSNGYDSFVNYAAKSPFVANSTMMFDNKVNQSPDTENRVPAFDLTLAVNTPEDSPNRAVIKRMPLKNESVIHVIDSCENSPVRETGKSLSNLNGETPDVQMDRDSTEYDSDADVIGDSFDSGSSHNTTRYTKIPLIKSKTSPQDLESDLETSREERGAKPKINGAIDFCSPEEIQERNSFSKMNALSETAEDSPIHTVKRGGARKCVIESSDDEDLPSLNAGSKGQDMTSEELNALTSSDKRDGGQNPARRKSQGKFTKMTANDSEEDYVSAESGLDESTNQEDKDSEEEESDDDLINDEAEEGDAEEIEDERDAEGTEDDEENEDDYEDKEESENDEESDMASFIVPDDEVSDGSESSEEEESGSEEEEDEETKKYTELVEKASEFYQAKDLKRALHCILQALSIDGSDIDLQRYALKIKHKLEKQKQREGLR